MGPRRSRRGPREEDYADNVARVGMHKVWEEIVGMYLASETVPRGPGASCETGGQAGVSASTGSGLLRLVIEEALPIPSKACRKILQKWRNGIMLMTDTDKLLWSKRGFYGATRKCDYEPCSKPITFLTYKGRKGGEFCSNACLESFEVGSVAPKAPPAVKKVVTDPTQKKETTTMAKTAAAHAPKKAAKKAAAPAAAPEAAEKVGGRYRAGSNNATYLERLSDEKPHTIEELADGLDMKYPNDPIFYIGKHGKEDKTWSLVKDKEAKTYTLTLTAKGRKLFGK